MWIGITLVGVGPLFLLLGGWWIFRGAMSPMQLPIPNLYQATVLVVTLLTLFAALGALYYAWSAQRKPQIILQVNGQLLHPNKTTKVPVTLDGRRATFNIRIENAADVTAEAPRLHFTAEPSFPIDAPDSAVKRVPALGNSYFWVQAEDLYPRRKSHGIITVVADIPEHIRTPSLFIMVNAKNYPDAIEKRISWSIPNQVNRLP